MNSIDIANPQMKALAAFYRRHVLPLCKPGAAGALLPRYPDGSTTFYVVRKATRMTSGDFELSMANERQIIEALRARWKGTPLETVPEPLVKLARQFEHTEQQAQLSAFIYEMF